MASKIMSINAGSSSLKFQVFEMPEETLLVKGLFERIGLEEEMGFSYSLKDAKVKTTIKGKTHEEAIEFLLHFLLERNVLTSLQELAGVGHRVAHGGEDFKKSSLVDRDALQKIKVLGKLAPLHNPVNVVGIEALQKDLPDCPQVAVFDTSFHQTMEAKNYIYPLPYRFYEEDSVRRYGFHGTSHQFVASEAANCLEKPLESLKIISCHLGNGASICGIKDGKSVITSMGFTPLAGLMMGTRCGDIDPSIIPFLQNEKNLSANDMDKLMNAESGFKGITGFSNDTRDIITEAEKGNDRAKLALDMFASRVKQTIGAYAAELDGVDVLIFTAGIGENSSVIREMVCENLTFLGIELDPQMNQKNNRRISTETSKVEVLVVETNEELMIVRDTYHLI
ncbi:acetate kinase [Enterococcus avium]|uniref:acetate/propionate family kinase n=1 Tax=Enterococcus avium TaxID=33945 RepID=UPI001D0766D8|nr:acetate kinase [Enterococcus avium]MCB6531207.1 acetate kinase [Enterococcus avium]MCG4868933.1 acetate kinase [Enterococcus avium]MCQ4677128.1 acetate kinase [Enterococcus avium]